MITSLPVISGDFDISSRAIQRSAVGSMLKPEKAYGTYVVDYPTYCQTGTTVIPIEIPQVLNSTVLLDGKLNPAAYSAVVEQYKTISSEAFLKLPVHDIDSDAPNGEVDHVYFNDYFIGTLTGSNNEWSDGGRAIPIEYIKFGQTNYIKIVIDVNGAGWCMGTDWAAIEFDVATPIVLAHGIAASADTWNAEAAPGFLAALEQTGLNYQRYSLAPNGSVEENSINLHNQISQFLTPLQADKVNIIAHSKGGLDAQALAPLQKTYEVESLTTISTPHLGSVLADLGLLYQHKGVQVGEPANEHVDKYLSSGWLWTVDSFGPQLPGMADLATYNAQVAIGDGFRGLIKLTYSIAANADLNHDGVLSENETEGFAPGQSLDSVLALTNSAWNLLRHVNSVVYLRTEAESFDIPPTPGSQQSEKITIFRVYYEAQPSNTVHDNDIAVTSYSAHPAWSRVIGTEAAHHSSVKSAQTLQRIFDANPYLLGAK